MTAIPGEDDSGRGIRARRCIATGEVLPDARLVRFVLDPEGNVIPDIDAKLPGRGYWVSADAELIAGAVKRRLFSKAARQQANAPEDLPARTEAGIVERMLAHLGLARRAGQLILGFDRVETEIRGAAPPAVIIEACDSGHDGRRKLYGAARSAGYIPYVIAAFSNAELSLSLGRENVVHAAVKPGRIAERLIFDAARLKGFRLPNPWIWEGFSGA